MRDYNAQLLCTFAKQDTYMVEIESLSKYYNIIDKKIYVLQSGNNKNDLFLTYNVEKSTNSKFYPNTISIHRKKEYNTIYSINALNEMIKLENGGMVSNTYQIDWESYRNSFITARDGQVKVTPTRLLKIIKIDIS